MLLVLRDLAQALDQERPISDKLNELTTLLIGVGAAFHFAGDMAREDFAEIVRPDMAAFDEELTGLWNRDHNVFVRELRNLQCRLATADAKPAAVQRFKNAVSSVWELHALVCERAVGMQRSLNGSGDETKMSGPEELMHVLRPRVVMEDRAAKALKDKARGGDAKCPFGSKLPRNPAEEEE